MTKKDFTVYYPLHDGKRYHTTPHSFNAMTAGPFNNPEHTLNFLKECFLTKEECDEKCKTPNVFEDMVREGADNYVGHLKESGEDMAITMMRNGFIDGVHWIIDNFNVKL